MRKEKEKRRERKGGQGRNEVALLFTKHYSWQ